MQTRQEPRAERWLIVREQIPAAAIPAPVPLAPVACTKCGAATEPRPGGLCRYCLMKLTRVDLLGPRFRFGPA
ncbi:MAG: hypothetical protein BGO49_04440 [Planctomycetales bacterium 71-10]|nr:MAG: hypothetical protein BGO49_04440 [Planctomycetales bacterium 71-10]